MTARFWCVTIWKILNEDVEDIYLDAERGENYIKNFLQAAVGGEPRIRYFIGQVCDSAERYNVIDDFVAITTARY